MYLYQKLLDASEILIIKKSILKEKWIYLSARLDAVDRLEFHNAIWA